MRVNLRLAVVPTVGSGVVRDSEKSEVADLDDFRPRITMGNPIVTEILGFRMSDFQKPKQSWRKNRKNENRFQPFQRLPLGYTITEYELPTPSGAGDYSWRDLKSEFLGVMGVLDHFQWDLH